jgi:hypothetical protein
MSNRADATQLDTAITAYTVRVKIPHLKRGKPRTVEFRGSAGVRKDLFVLTGAFARVYPWTDAAGKERAVRCFYTIPPSEVQDRYKAIDQFFRQNLPENTAELAYHEQGLVIKGTPPDPDLLMPLIEMEWVEGETLVNCVDRLATRNDKAGLQRLRQGWLDLMSRMWELRMAHGDLSGENVMVRQRNGSLVLVDYDSVYIPAFRGKTSDQAGNPAYQHRETRQREFNERMDDFSALLIYVALFALSEQPARWATYAAHDAGGKLKTDTILFQPDDIAGPAQSPLFRDLGTIKNSDFQKLLQALRQACEGPLRNVPEFALLVNPALGRQAAETRLREATRRTDADAAAAVVAAANDPALAAPPISDPALVAAVAAAKKQVAQAAELEGHLARQDDAKALATWKRDNFHQTAKGRSYTSRLAPIEQRLTAITALQHALTANDDGEAVRLWDTQTAFYKQHAPQFEGQVAQARARLDRTRPFLEALRQGRDAEAVRLWEAGLKSYAPAQRHAGEVQAAQGRITAARQAVQQAIARNDELAIAKVADDHAARLAPADLAPHAARIQQARDRIAQRERLEGLLQTENDSATLNCWQANGFDQCSLAAPFTARVGRVKQRWERWQQIEQIMQGGRVPGQEQRLFDAWDEALFQTYRRADAYRPTYEEAKKQLAQLQPLRAALARRPVDDSAILAAWEPVKHLPSADPYRRAVEQVQQRLNQARRAALDQLAKAINARDERLIKAAWENSLLRRTDPEVQRLQPEVEKALARLAAAAQIAQQAGTADHDEEVLRLWQQHRLEGSTLGEPLKAQIAAVEQRHQLFEQVVAALRRHDDTQLLTLWDDRLLRDYPPLRPHQVAIEEARQRLRSVPALRTALQTGNDKLVMVIWDSLKGRDLPDAAPLEPEVRARKLHWLGARVPRHLDGTLDGTTLTLTWDWPEGLLIVGVTVRSAAFATAFAPNTLGQTTWWSRRADYARDKQFVARLNGRYEQAYVRIFALAQHGREWLTAPYQVPVQLLLQPSRTVTYRLRREANGTTYLEVETGGLPALPALRIMAGAAPPVPGATGVAGAQVGLVQPIHRVGNSSLYRVPLLTSHWHQQVYLTLVPTNLNDQRWLRLVPAGGGTALPVPPLGVPMP